MPGARPLPGTADGSPETEFAQFRSWLDDFVDKGSQIMSDDFYERVQAFLKSDSQKGAKGQAGDAKFRHTEKYHLVTAPQLGLHDVVFTLNEQNKPRRVVPLSQIAKVLYDVHVIQTLHGGIRKTHRALGDHYVGIPEKVVRQFLLMCPLCTMQRDVDGTPVDIVSMQHAPDGQFLHILHLRDQSSRFNVLAPLTNADASAVAHELLHMFALFGPCACLMTGAGATLQFLHAVQEELQVLWPGLRLGLKSHVPHSDLPFPELGSGLGSSRLAQVLQDWSSSTNRSDWGSVLPLIQWQLNTEKDTLLKLSPFVLALGRKPRRIIGDDDQVEESADEETLSSLLDAPEDHLDLGSHDRWRSFSTPGLRQKRKKRSMEELGEVAGGELSRRRYGGRRFSLTATDKEMRDQLGQQTLRALQEQMGISKPLQEDHMVLSGSMLAGAGGDGHHDPAVGAVEGNGGGMADLHIDTPLARFMNVAGLGQFTHLLVEAWVDMGELATIGEAELLELGLPAGACKKLKRTLARWPNAGDGP
eukprot:SM000079S22451  [mRNA]  locus=s79:233180:237018:- [translate_table: standard]